MFAISHLNDISESGNQLIPEKKKNMEFESSTYSFDTFSINCGGGGGEGTYPAVLYM